MLFDKVIDDVVKAYFPQEQKQVPLSVVDTGLASSGSEGQYGDVGTLNKTYEKIVWVFRCINIIASNIASLPIVVNQYDAKGNKTDISHLPEFQILQHPNPWQTKYDFWMESISRLELQGELFWELGYNGGRVPRQMFADWRSEEVDIKADPDKFITEFLRIVNGKVFHFPAEQIFYIKYFNPQTTLRGMSPLRAARDTLTLELNALTYNKSFFKSGMKMSGIINVPNDRPRDEEIERARDKFAQLYGGVDKAHQVGFLWGGATFTPLNTMTMQEAEFSGLRKMNREEIAALYGVPLEILGVGKSTYANWQEARRSFWQETLLAKLLKIYSLLNEFLLPRLTVKPNVIIEPDLDGVEALQEDRTEMARRFFEGWGRGAVTPNEIRTQVYNLDPIDEPEMNSTYLPFNVVPVGGETEGQAPGKALSVEDLKKKEALIEVLISREQRYGKP